MQVTLRIRRHLPERTPAEFWQTYTLEADPSDRVLDLLVRAKDEQDGTLTFRRSCAHGICGSDAMRINGANRLACKMLVGMLGETITVEPLLGLQVERDLIVDMQPFFDAYRAVEPFVINDSPLPADGRERLQSQAERMRFDDTTKCILCGACTTACPVFWSNDRYLGPMAFVQAHRFLFDSRDQAPDRHVAALAGEDGIWKCRTIFHCTLACPREIQITKAIAEVKQALLRQKA